MTSWSFGQLKNDTKTPLFFSPCSIPFPPVIFATATVVAFVLLCNSRFNFHCYTQHEATPIQKSARKWRCNLSTSHNFLCERLQRAFTRANQIHWTAQYRCSFWHFSPYSCIIGGSCHKYNFYCDKRLSQQTRFCHNKYVFVVTKRVFCHDKHTFVATKDVFCHDKHVFVVTKAMFMFVATNICCDKNMFVSTNVLLQTKTCFVVTNMFVATKVLLWQTLHLW